LLVSAGLALACAYLFLRAAVDLHRSGHARAAASLPWAVIIGAVGAAWLLFQPMVVPTSAMEQTLLAGDHVVVENAGALACRSPKRGELVVFRYPVDRRNIFVKRIIGVPGDRLRFRSKRLYRNGAPVDEPYAYLATSHTDSYRDDFPGVPNLRLYAPGEAMLKENVRDDEVIVPEGKFFVPGDNRDNSLDSRYWGFVEAADVTGKPVLVYQNAKTGWGLRRVR
jgi:signal peptidase I